MDGLRSRPDQSRKTVRGRGASRSGGVGTRLTSSAVGRLRRWTAPRLDLLWPRLDALIDRAGDADLRSHRLEVLGARRRRANGRPVPAAFVEQERAAAVAAITAPLVLERVAAAYEKPAVLVKGPEVAALYPAPALRNYWDLDLLVGDAEEAQNALLAAGFEAVGDPDLYVDIHHLRPLRPPGLVLAVELHTTPKWLDGRMAPAVSELLAASIPRDEGPGGIRRLPPEQHALLLAAHSWAHEPLRRLRDLLDIALVAAAADPAETARLARSWGIERFWRTTRAVLAGLEDGRTDAAAPLLLGAQSALRPASGRCSRVTASG